MMLSVQFFISSMFLGILTEYSIALKSFMLFCTSTRQGSHMNILLIYYARMMVSRLRRSTIVSTP